MTTRSRLFLDVRVGWLVLAAFCCLALIPVEARAAMIESRLASGETISERAAQMETIRQALEKDVVRQKLADYGLSTEEISAKLPTLSDAQIHQLAGLSEDVVAGDGLGAVIALLIIILLIVIILKVSGRQIIIR